MANIADYTRILKDFYDTGGLHDAIDREIPLLARFQRMVLDWTGRQAVFAVRVGRGVDNVGYRAEGVGLPLASVQEKVNLNITANLLYGTFELSGPLMASAKNKVGSFVQALESEMDGAVDDVKNDASRALYVGGGCVGFITIRGPVVADTTEVEFFGNVEEIPTVPGGGAGQAEMSLIRMDDYEIQPGGAAYNQPAFSVYREAAGNLTVRFSQSFDFSTAALAAGAQTAMASGIPFAVFLTNGNGVKPQTLVEPIGIYGNLAQQNHFGINRNTSGANVPAVTLQGKQHLRACVRQNTMAEPCLATPLAQGRMEAVLTELQEFPFAGKKTDLLVMRPTTRQSYVALISNTNTLQTETNKAGHGDVGVGSISYNGITMMSDRQCGRGLILFLNTSAWKLAQLKGADIEDLDGNVLQRLVGFDAYTGHVSWYYNTICIMPNCQGALVGFDFPGLP
tara:strand:- start:2139 stop:3497 length:1359 start_codon:yes stop_codon:yes gene_type:complete